MNATPLDLPALLLQLSNERPIFHSEADFQHALAWLIQRTHPTARIRLETRPERGIRLDLLVNVGGHRSAIELKYLVSRFDGVVDGERFNLPNQAAQDISRHDYCKDVGRVETFVADGIADDGWAVALSNDRGYWNVGWKQDPVDAAFRLHEGRVLEGELRWDVRAGAGTTRKRDVPLILLHRYDCRWRDYSIVSRSAGDPVHFRYLALAISP